MTDPTQRTTDQSAVDDLAAVLAANQDVLRGIGPEQGTWATPCPGFDVDQLVDHLLGWSEGYAARLSGEQPPQDPAEHRAGDDPAAELHGHAERIVAGYRDGSSGADELPIGVVLMDELTHGWDLAVSTRQPLRFPESAAERALATGRQMLTADNRGDSFGPPVDPPEGATSLERLVAFLGREPRWTPSEA